MSKPKKEQPLGLVHECTPEESAELAAATNHLPEAEPAPDSGVAAGPEVRLVNVDVPMGEPDDSYMGYHTDVQWQGGEREALRMLRNGLVKSHTMYRVGGFGSKLRPVATGADALRWLLQQLEQ